MTKQELIEELMELIHDSPVHFQPEARKGLKDAREFLESLGPVSVTYDDYGVHCGNCGDLLRSDYNFCPKCGTEIDWN